MIPKLFFINKTTFEVFTNILARMNKKISGYFKLVVDVIARLMCNMLKLLAEQVGLSIGQNATVQGKEFSRTEITALPDEDSESSGASTAAHEFLSVEPYSPGPSSNRCTLFIALGTATFRSTGRFLMVFPSRADDVFAVVVKYPGCVSAWPMSQGCHFSN
jgi:hypothetical protein